MVSADALSRLPLKTLNTQVPKPPELIHLVEHLNTTPRSNRYASARTTAPLLHGSRSWYKMDGQHQKGWIIRTFSHSAGKETN